MIAAFMLYSIVIATLFALAALLAERAAASLGVARRSVWVVAMASSLIAPAVAIGLGSRQDTTPPGIVALADAPLSAPSEISAAIEPAGTMLEQMAAPLRRIELPQLDVALSLAWGIASTTLIAFYVGAWIRTRRLLRRCRIAMIAGRTVRVSEDIGPAVFGLTNPTIIVPEWLRDVPAAQRTLVLEHEYQHVVARDPLTLVLALGSVLIAPWNVAMWWQLKRLRFAIEVDCDARVVERGADALTYSETLLHVGRQFLRAPLTAIALIEPPSDLERRIRILTSDRQRRAAAVAVACATLCTSLVVVAAQIDPPTVASNDLTLLPPQLSLPERVEAIVRSLYPELFDASPAQPALVELVLGNDLSVKWSERKLVSSEQAAASEIPSRSMQAILGARRPDFVARIMMSRGIGAPPVFVSFAGNVTHESRSPTVVEVAVKARFPDLYDDAADADAVVVALMSDRGEIERAIKRPRSAGESLASAVNQRRALASIAEPDFEPGMLAVIPSSREAPFKPAVVYAFPRSQDPSVDADPNRAQDRGRTIAAMRAIVERHFADVADGSSNPHALLWVMLDASGQVIDTGRDAKGPDPLMLEIEQRHPGAAVAQSETVPLASMFGKPMPDAQGEPLLAKFIWLRDEDRRTARTGSASRSISVDTTIYRNGTVIDSTQLTLKVGEAQSFANELLRVQFTATAASEELVDIGTVIRVPRGRNGVEFAESWETVARPMIRAAYGKEAAIEQGVRYPGKEGDVVWKIVLKPHEAI